jgi:hypothetical protein
VGSGRLGDPEGQGARGLPPLDVNLQYGFDFAAPIFRLGNDYSKGHHRLERLRRPAHVEQPGDPASPTGTRACRAGGVLNGDGQLVGIPIGRMQGDYRFSFILPLRAEMFRKVSFLN